MRRWQIVTLYVICSFAAHFSQDALAQATIQQILNNGPTDKRINIVYLSEGYTNTQLSCFITDAAYTLNAMLSTPPYSVYRHYFNASAILVASSDSGSDHPSRNIFRNTFFNSTFDSYGIARLITIDVAGWRRVDSLLQLLMPEYDIVVMIVNDPEYGGSGGFPAIASVNSASQEIVIHELGHSFAGLGDEYSDPYPGYADIEEPNTTRETRLGFIKWRAWILSSTPIPTPQTSQYGTVVGLFEGAHYYTTGWYRPKLNCKMRTLGVQFCNVCSETIVKSIYRYVRPIESYSPMGSVISLADSQFVSLSIVPIKPFSYIQWFIDGIQRNGATSSSCTVSGTEIGIGQHTVHVIVRDTTSLVRNDSTSLLRDSISWAVHVSGTSLVENDLSDHMPKRYSLGQNYPNPFNPTTIFSFSLPSKSFVSLKVFDLMGKEVTTVISEELSIGSYTKQWNPAAFSSGVYFYRLQAGIYSETKKLLLLR